MSVLDDPKVQAAIAAAVAKAPPLSEDQLDLLRRLRFPFPAAPRKAAS